MFNWSKKDSENLKIIANSSIIISKSLAKIAQLDIDEITESRPIQGAVRKIEYLEYNPEQEYLEEQEKLNEKRFKNETETGQFWREDEEDLESL
jgi:hypothetical protein